jgi:hypothetical protein
LRQAKEEETARRAMQITRFNVALPPVCLSLKFRFVIAGSLQLVEGQDAGKLWAKQGWFFMGLTGPGCRETVWLGVQSERRFSLMLGWCFEEWEEDG